MQYMKVDNCGGKQLSHLMDESWLPPGLAAKIIGGNHFTAALGSLTSLHLQPARPKDCH